MSSPYAPGANKVRRMAAAHDVPAASQDGIRGGVRVGGVIRQSAGPAFGANGEINASSTKELMQAIANVVTASSQQTTVVPRGASKEAAAERTAALVEAYHDRSGEKFQVLGEVYSDEIWETLGREGFSRKLFAVQNVAPGQLARVKVRRKDVVAYQVTSDVRVQEQRIRQPWIYPPSTT